MIVRVADGSALLAPGFVRFALSRLLGWAGAGMTLVALPVVILDLTGSAALTALLAVVEALPYLAFGLFAGAWGDRVRRRTTLVIACVLNAVAMASIPVAALADALTVPHLLAVGLLVASLNVFADAASFGALPTLVGRDRVASAQGLMTAAGTLVGIGAPALAGVLIGLVGSTSVLWIEAVAFGVSAVLYAGLRLGGADAAATAVGLWSSIAEGLRFILAQPLIRGLTLFGAGLSLAGGGVLGLQVVVAVRELGVSTDGYRIGLLFTAAAVGSAVAGLSVGPIRRRLRAGSVASVGYGIGWILLLCFAFAPGFWWAIVALGCWQFVSTTVIVNGIVARQQLAPEHLQGRVNTTARMIAWGGQPVGAALAAALATPLGPRWAIAVVGTALLGSLVGAVLVRLDRLPAAG